jgi:hypothetical protein
MAANRNRLFFYLSLFLLLTYPVTRHLNLFIYGVRTEGIVNSGSYQRIEESVQIYRIIHFTADGVVYKVNGPLNVSYDFGTKCKVIYNKKDPSDCIIPSFLFLYTSFTAMCCYFILLVWVAFYTSFRPGSNKHPDKEASVQHHSISEDKKVLLDSACENL